MNIDKITLYYNQNGLQNQLVGIIGDYHSDEKKIIDNNIIYYQNKKVIGFNIKNGGKFVNSNCQGMIYPGKDLLLKISNYLKIDLTNFINQKTYLVGFVKECNLIPKTHLHDCKILVNDNEALNIVCGAANVKINKKVVVATIGTRLPDGKFIKENKLLGYQSQGMLCSEKELNLDTNSSGIMLLPDDIAFPSEFLQVYKFV